MRLTQAAITSGAYSFINIIENALRAIIRTSAITPATLVHFSTKKISVKKAVRLAA